MCVLWCVGVRQALRPCRGEQQHKTKNLKTLKALKALKKITCPSHCALSSVRRLGYMSEVAPVKSPLRLTLALLLLVVCTQGGHRRMYSI